MKYNITNENKAAIVERLKESAIPYWELAEALGVHENTLNKMMRRPNDEQTERILEAVATIIKQRNQ